MHKTSADSKPQPGHDQKTSHYDREAAYGGRVGLTVILYFFFLQSLYKMPCFSTDIPARQKTSPFQGTY